MPVFLRVVLIFCLILILIIFSFFILGFKLSIRADGATVSSPKTSFYLPAENPAKVYKFNSKPPELLKIIEENTKNQPATFGIYLKNISTGQEVSLNAEEEFSAASLYKLALMYTIHKKGEKGELNLTDPDIKKNLNDMITISSNEAAYLLVDKYTSWSEVTEDMHELGLNNTSLNQNPTITTPSDMGRLLELMALGKTINMEVSVSMLELMLAQQRNDRIPVHLPPTALVAHKTGELVDVRHDAGVVVTAENNYILVLMSKESENPELVKPVMSQISKQIYDFFATQWVNPPEIF